MSRVKSRIVYDLAGFRTGEPPPFTLVGFGGLSSKFSQAFTRAQLAVSLGHVLVILASMADQWIIRVQDREFGPAGLDTLKEWKSEGRLLARNPARRIDADFWTTAGEIPGLFDGAVEIVPPIISQNRSFGQILAQTFHVYGKGFFPLFFFSLLPTIPAFFLQLSLPSFQLGDKTAVTSWAAIRPSFFLVFMVAFFVLVWPVFLAGIQLTSAAVLESRQTRLADLFRSSIRLWPRMAKLSLLVYGSYFVWSVLPIVVAGGFIVGDVSVLWILLALLILAFQVFMTARLWINFMFWQQSAALADLSGMGALHESKTLARSGQGNRWIDRPLYRGAIIISLWILFAIFLSSAVQLPFLFIKLKGATTLEEVQTVLQNLASAHSPEPLMIAAYAVSALAHAAVRPLLGIAFVVLYFDAKGTAANRG